MHLYLACSGENALRLVALLARLGRRVPTREIAELTGIPRGDVPGIAAALSRAGILGNRPGSGGGCRLLRSPEDITVLDVVEAVEGPVARDGCLLDRERPHRTLGYCVVHEAWMAAQDAVMGALRSVTVADLARDRAAPTGGRARGASDRGTPLARRRDGGGAA